VEPLHVAAVLLSAGDQVTRAPNAGTDGTFSAFPEHCINVPSVPALSSRVKYAFSSKYPEYFQNHILPKMAADRAEMLQLINSREEAGSDGLQTVQQKAESRSERLERKTWVAKAMAELQYVEDDYHRRVVGDKAAGLESALSWARSDDPEIRRFAVEALEPIESRIAAAELKRLANSPDSRTAENARRALGRRAEDNRANT
jgi:hypothetical protein